MLRASRLPFDEKFEIQIDYGLPEERNPFVNEPNYFKLYLSSDNDYHSQSTSRNGEF
jgi:hypothetical protein